MHAGPLRTLSHSLASSTRPRMAESAMSAGAVRGRAGAADARWQQRSPRPQNVPGDFYVDRTCIDCDTCRWMAPAVFGRLDEQSAVVAQPAGQEARLLALEALHSCPTFSIHVRGAPRGELAAAAARLPKPVPGCRSVLHCGYADEATFGATAYLVRRPSGNILVDVPRWSPALADRIDALGGVRFIFVTHRDDVGAHARWAERFGAQRIIHALDVRASQGTDRAERQLEGEGPWQVDDAGDAQILFTPGHTAGSLCLLYRPDAALFTGDSLAHSARLGRLTIFRNYNWHSVAQQLRSVASLRSLPDGVRHVLPGHGRRAAFDDQGQLLGALAELLEAEGHTEGTAVPS